MFRWLKRRVNIAAVKAATEDLEQHILRLRGMADREIGFLVASATLTRLRLKSIGALPDASLNLSLPRDEFECDMVQMSLNKLINDFQKREQFNDAAGTIIWLYSVRALNMPEIRLLGRQMWHELSRGFPYVVDGLEEIREFMGTDIPDNAECEALFFPIGLEPDS